MFSVRPFKWNQALSLTCSKSPPSPIPECSTLKQEGNAMYAKDQLAEGKAGIRQLLGGCSFSCGLSFQACTVRHEIQVADNRLKLIDQVPSLCVGST
ncbi:hypothetical protein RUM43_012173 [Polyplax serrata]|uniref:Uncharacterized protein n=1 Tax=Polyplax serrata TaxID=468196 RepID=A0AAN8NRT7_POLSC